MNLLTLKKYHGTKTYRFLDTEGKECDKQNVKWYEKNTNLITS